MRTVGAEGKWENGPDSNSTENSSSSVSLALAVHRPWAERSQAVLKGLKVARSGASHSGLNPVSGTSVHLLYDSGEPTSFLTLDFLEIQSFPLPPPQVAVGISRDAHNTNPGVQTLAPAPGVSP